MNNSFLNKLFYILNISILGFCRLLLIVMVIVVSYSVIGRYVFASSPSWGQEAGTFCLIWVSTISSSLAVIPNTHLRVLLLDLILPNKYLDILDIIVDIITFGFAVFLIVQGIRFTQLGMLSSFAGMQIKKAWLFACIPFTGFSIIVSLLEVYLVQGGRKVNKRNEH